MEIPNYDSTDNSDKKYKQLYPYMRSDTFRMLICGNSGSGKANLLYHMIIKPLLYYDEIYLYARNLEQDKYKKLVQKMRELSMKLSYEILHVSNDEITPVTEMDYEDSQKLVIFDDYVCDKNQRQLIDNLLGVDKAQYKAATRKPFTFLYVDKPKKFIAKNFTDYIRNN